jgi:multiple sugar transport system permease protein
VETVPSSIAAVRSGASDRSRRKNPSPLSRLADWLENEAVLGYLLMVPALLLILVFIAYPFGLGVWLAFSDKLVGREAHFIGFSNFTKILDSQIFVRTALNTVLFTALATVLKGVLGMWLALLLNRKFRGARFTRAAVLLPFIVPTVLSTLAWLWIFDSTFGVINWTLRHLWMGEWTLLGMVVKESWGVFPAPQWLGNPTLAMSAIVIVNTWRGIPFFAISFLAGLQTINPDLYDAGDIDGASGWQKFWHITAPLLKPITVVVVVFSMVVTFADFQLVYVLTRGGPANSTHLFATLAYQLGMASGNLGEGAAVALFMLPILALVIVFQLWYLRKDEA